MEVKEGLGKVRGARLFLLSHHLVPSARVGVGFRGVVGGFLASSNLVTLLVGHQLEMMWSGAAGSALSFYRDPVVKESNPGKGAFKRV